MQGCPRGPGKAACAVVMAQRWVSPSALCVPAVGLCTAEGLGSAACSSPRKEFSRSSWSSMWFSWKSQNDTVNFPGLWNDEVHGSRQCHAENNFSCQCNSVKHPIYPTKITSAPLWWIWGVGMPTVPLLWQGRIPEERKWSLLTCPSPRWTNRFNLFPWVTALRQVIPTAKEDRTHRSLDWIAFSFQNKLNLSMLIVLYYSDSCWISTLGVDFGNEGRGRKQWVFQTNGRIIYLSENKRENHPN